MLEENVYNVRCPKGHIYAIHFGNQLEERCAENQEAHPGTVCSITEDECDECREHNDRIEDMIATACLFGENTW